MMLRKKVASCTILLSIILASLYACDNTRRKAVPQTHTIIISGMQFQPAEITVEKGDTLVFVNKDVFVHDITEEKSKAWKSSPLSTGQSYKLEVKEPAGYYCSLHPIMKGKIILR